jgi:predicted esterase
MKQVMGYLTILLGLTLGLQIGLQNRVLASVPTTSLKEASAESCDLPGFTQMTEENGTTVVLPASYDKQQQYPAIVLLPYTDGTACEFFEWIFQDLYDKNPDQTYVMILPARRSSRADYSSGEVFEATIEEYEALVRQDLDALIPKYNLDATRISLAGFSFGADLGWALSLRNPDTFHGALLIDSLCTYRLDRNLDQLAQNDTRFFLIMGRKEDYEETHPMNAVKELLERHQVATASEEFPNASHSMIMEEIPTATLIDAIDYVLSPE